MAVEIRLVQLARMLGLGLRELDREGARRAIMASPETLADAFFAEAADSDDVTSTQGALDYLEDRLAFFADYVPRGAAAPVRAAFRERLRAWEA